MRNTSGNDHTLAVHAGEPDPKIEGALSIPIFQSSIFETYGAERYHDIKYIRLSNTPNHIAVHSKLAALERTDAAIVTASGMAAVSTVLLGLLSAGDHLLVQSSLYAGTQNLLTTDLLRLGITFDSVNVLDILDLQRKLKPNTKMLYVESIANPLLQIPDFSDLIAFAHENNLTAVIDNTFATPINFNPVCLGFDVVIHSCSKYLGGHSDLVAGAVVGKASVMETLYSTLTRIGASLNPIDCYLLHRSLKTLPLRIERQNRNAMEIAQWLETHPRVTNTTYPGLNSHPQHDKAQHYFRGYGGMVTFDLGGRVEAVDQFLAHLRLITIAPSLGGVESTITKPAATSHFCISAEERHRMGVTDTLLRMSVGIEQAEDIIADIDHALSML